MKPVQMYRAVTTLPTLLPILIYANSFVCKHVGSLDFCKFFRIIQFKVQSKWTEDTDVEENIHFIVINSNACV